MIPRIHSVALALLFAATLPGPAQPPTGGTQLINPNPHNCCECITKSINQQPEDDNPGSLGVPVMQEPDGSYKFNLKVDVTDTAGSTTFDCAAVTITSIKLVSGTASGEPITISDPKHFDGVVSIKEDQVTKENADKWRVEIECGGIAQGTAPATDTTSVPCVLPFSIKTRCACESGACNTEASNAGGAYNQDFPAGASNGGDSSGLLRFKVRDLANPGPAGLAAFVPSNFTVTRNPSGVISSVVNPTTTIEVAQTPTTFDPNAFTITHKHTATAAEFRTTTISRAQEGSAIYLRSDSTFSNSTFRYQQSKTHTAAAGTVPASDTWVMESGPVTGATFTPLRKESLTISEPQLGTRIYRETTQERDAAASTFVTTADTATTWNKFAWGWEKTHESVDPDGANLVSTWTYYQPGEHTGPNASTEGLGQVHTYNRYNGHQEVHTYWLNHHQTQQPFADNPQGLTLLVQDNPATRTLTTTKSVGGHILSKESETFNPATNTRTATSHTSSTGALTTTTILRPYGQDFGGQPASVQHPDGTLTTYSYTRHSDGGKTVVVSTGAGSGGTVTKGKSTTTTTNRYGTVIRSVTDTVGYSTNVTVLHRAVTSVDALGRALTTAEFPAASSAPDGAVQATASSPKWTTTTSYSCCGVASETDKHGNETTYTYDEQHRRKTSTSNGVTSETVRKGLTTETHRYPAGGNAASGNLIARKTHNIANTVSSFWSPDPSSTTDGAFVETTIATSYAGGIATTVTTVPGGASQTSQTFADGSTWKTSGDLSPAKVHSYAVNSTGLLTTSSYLDGTTLKETTTTQGDWAGRALTIAKGPQMVTQTYNALGQLASSTDADGVRTLSAYNSLGERTTSAIDTNGNGTIDFNGTDSITVSTSEPGNYASTPVITSTTDVYATNGSATATTIRTSHSTPDGLLSWTLVLGVANPSSTVIDSATWTETTTNPDGTYVITTYTNGRLDHTTTYASNSAVLHTTSAGYDSLGRPVTSTDSRTGTTTTAYVSGTVDAVASVTDPGNRVTSFTYDFRGRNLSTTLPDSSVSYTSYRLDGQVAATWGSQTYPTYTTYDYAGRRKTLRTQPTLASGVPIDTGGSISTWNYSATTGLLTSKQDAADKETGYTYTSAGRLFSRTWARGLVTTYGYTAGQLTSTDYSDATPDVSITFDRLSRQISVTQMNQSQIATTYDPATLAPDTETISYDLDHDGSYEFTRVIDRSQDTLGRDTGFQLKNGSTVENQAAYGYSATDGRLSTIVGGGDVSSLQTFTYGYTPNSNLIASVTGPAHTVTNTWEPTRDVLASKLNKVGIDVISQYEYSVNAIGQRTGVNISGSEFPATPSWLWGYDSLGQIISANSSVNTSDRAYEYDAIGNRKKSANSLSLPTSDNYTSNVLNQYSVVNSVNPSYDDDGNATAYPLPASPTANSTLIWDAENRLVSTTVGAITRTILYDAQSRRIAETTGTITTHFVYDGWNCIAEYTGAALSKTRTWGLDLSDSLQGAGGVAGLLAEKQDSDIFYPTYDGNGNISEYLDSSGAVDSHFEYDSFGNTVVNTDTDKRFAYRFSTKPLNFETGLYYYGYRWYDPVTGRWLSRDPIEEQGGINLYGFVENNGINSIDLLGHIDWDSLWNYGRCVGDCYSDNDPTGMIIDNVLIYLGGGPIPKTLVASLYDLLGMSKEARLVRASLRIPGMSPVTTLPSVISVAIKGGGRSTLRVIGRVVFPIAVAQTAVDAILISYCACHCTGRDSYNSAEGNIYGRISDAVKEAFAGNSGT